MIIRVFGIILPIVSACAALPALAADKPKPILPDWSTYSCAWFTSDVAAVDADVLGVATRDRGQKVDVVFAFMAGYGQKLAEAKNPKAALTDELMRPVAAQVVSECQGDPKKLVIDVIDDVLARVSFTAG